MVAQHKGSHMKYSLICIFALGASLTASAGFLDKVSKAASVVDQGLKVVGDKSGVEAESSGEKLRTLVPEKVEIKDESVSTEEFCKEKNLSEDEYSEWLQSVLFAVQDPDGDFSKINTTKTFVYKDIQIDLPADEVVVRVNSADGVVLTDKASYRLYSAQNKGCVRNNYGVLALSGRTGSNYYLKKYGAIAENKLQEFLNIREQLAVAMQKEKRDEDRKSKLQNIEASRSGTVAFSGKVGSSELTLQWGDSADVLREMCGFHLEIPTLYGITDYFIGSVGDVFGDKTVSVCADIDVGLFQVEIVFSSQMMGGSVTLDDLKAKYLGRYGVPEELVDSSTEQIIGYRWVSASETVTVGYNNKMDANGTALGSFPTVILTNPEMDNKREMAMQERADKGDQARKAEAAKALDF